MIHSRVSYSTLRDTDLYRHLTFNSAGDFWSRQILTIFRKIHRHDRSRFQIEETFQKRTRNQSAIVGHSGTGTIQISRQIVRYFQPLKSFIKLVLGSTKARMASLSFSTSAADLLLRRFDVGWAKFNQIATKFLEFLVKNIILAL